MFYRENSTFASTNRVSTQGSVFVTRNVVMDAKI